MFKRMPLAGRVSRWAAAVGCCLTASITPPTDAASNLTHDATAAVATAPAPSSPAPARAPVPVPVPAAIVLTECRLEHPLKLTSVPARCGTLEVAERGDLAAGGGTLKLRIAVIRALNRQSNAAPLFILAGGPGQSAGDLYAATAGAFARINRDHDIVLVDQRGTGASGALNCPYPEEWQQSQNSLPELRRASLDCLAKLGDRVRWYTTRLAVEDLDTARRALGYERIDLYGSSYGTRVAESFMRRHPHAVHAVILDGVTDPERPIGPDTPLDGERALGLILARCAAATDCAAAFPNLAAELDELRRRFAARKESLTLPDPIRGTPLTVDFDRDVLSAALRFLSYNATQASLLPALVHEAAQGRLAPLAAQTVMMSREIGDQLASGMQNSVICSEDVPGFAISDADRARLAATYQGTLQLDALAEICRVWPRGPVDPELHAPLISDIPTLLLSGEADPVTPPVDAERAARGLRHHRLLVMRGEGHGQLATGCMPRVMAAFLERAEPATLDVSCTEWHRPAPFFVSLTGPSP